MPIILDGTTGEVFPTWTTGTRPASPVLSQTGWNTTIGSLENYNGTAWTAVGGGGAGQWQTVRTSGFTASSGEAYACNTTSAAFTVTLPASPSAGNFVQLVDYAGTWSANPVTVARNGSNIQGSALNVTLSTNRQAVAFVYIDATQGWLCYSQGAGVGTYTVSYFIAAGGGGGNINQGGGGGAGGYITSTTTSVSPGVAYSIVIGGGGAVGGSGSNSSGFSLTAIGGGFGGLFGGAAGTQLGTSGGSGGGGSTTTNANGAGGAGTAGQGFAGGTGVTDGGATYRNGGGGGGAGGAGVTNSSNGNGGAGGVGISSTISGTSTFYCGGGGGSSSGAGGTGGGGAAGNPATAGTANRGGGGGGGVSTLAGAGGSGIAIISYAGAQRGTGGTVTSVGGNTIHTFLTSGTYTA